ncbi:hypothetical protein HOY82DRAFT_545348 [Tuber indicum]|nr:hypothetical protein HOY82DRAFT_545348 [Tuber indicum]
MKAWRNAVPVMVLGILTPERLASTSGDSAMAISSPYSTSVGSLLPDSRSRLRFSVNILSSGADILRYGPVCNNLRQT